MMRHQTVAILNQMKNSKARKILFLLTVFFDFENVLLTTAISNSPQINKKLQIKDKKEMYVLFLFSIPQIRQNGIRFLETKRSIHHFPHYSNPRKNIRYTNEIKRIKSTYSDKVFRGNSLLFRMSNTWQLRWNRYTQFVAHANIQFPTLNHSQQIKGTDARFISLLRCWY